MLEHSIKHKTKIILPYIELPHICISSSYRLLHFGIVTSQESHHLIYRRTIYFAPSRSRMEQQVLQLLQATTVPDTNTIKRAEQSLLDLHQQPEYPFALLNIATHADLDAGSRKAALTALRNYVNLTWSPNFEEASSQRINLSEDARTQIRSQILAICTNSGPSNDMNQNLAGKRVVVCNSLTFLSMAAADSVQRALYPKSHQPIFPRNGPNYSHS